MNVRLTFLGKVTETDPSRCIIIAFAILQQPLLFVELTLRGHCDKWVTPTWIMDNPTGQTLGQKAVRPCGPLCVTSLAPYKFNSSQNWHWAVLQNPKLRSQSALGLIVFLCVSIPSAQDLLSQAERSLIGFNFHSDCLFTSVYFYYPDINPTEPLKTGLTVINSRSPLF